MDRDQIATLISETLDQYFNEVDPADTDTDDLAETVLHRLERAGAITKVRTGHADSPAAAADTPACACRGRGQDGDGRVRYDGRDGEFVNLPCRDHAEDAQCPQNPGGKHAFRPAALDPGRFCAYCGNPETAVR